MSILNQKHCCEVMEGILERSSEGALTFKYINNIRMYLVNEVIKDKNRLVFNGCNKILYCPWCGTKLPESLGDKIDEVLEKEYNLIDAWSDENKNKIPAEFQTDEWWKKRGL
ncbi:MAG TPA: hypothetical protein VGW78_02940 [Candidatus Babeliales bacterium]|jgi:hypothetical protein|nr:hypothetical protein [Candidatus Babeliales bacterium]